MFLDFDSMPENSRIWIYQTTELLNQESIDFINKYLRKSIEGWESHGSPLKGSFKLFFDRIIVLAVDPSFNLPSGCSIDSSGRWIKELNNELRVDFFDRSLPYFDKNDELRFVPIFEIKKHIASGSLSSYTEILNNQIQDLSSLKSNWKVKAIDSYLKRYFEPVSI